MRLRYFLGFLFLVLVAILGARPTRSAPALEAPQTLAASWDVRGTLQGFEQVGEALLLRAGEGTVTSEVFHSDWEWIALGITWDIPLPAGVEPELEVRVSADGATWGTWQPLTLIGEHRPDGSTLTATELHFAPGRFAQVRATLQAPEGTALRWEGLRLTVIDGRPGPTAAELAAARAPGSSGPPTVVTRAQWGADERLRFDSQGNETWPREYHSLRALFVHHTATAPTYPDAAAAVRSIYYYHAITNGWGDIGYQYLVDQYGTIYQGRYGTEQNGLVVEGAHALGYNRNTMGVSLIGNFVAAGPGGAQMDALKQILGWRAALYGIDPARRVWLDGVGTISPDRWFDYSLLGHRDSHTPARTTCPGDGTYSRLGEIRRDVSTIAAGAAVPPTVQIAAPVPASTLNGSVTLQANASPNTTRVEWLLDGSLLATSSSPPWSVTVASASLPAGGFTLAARAWNAFEQSSEATQPVTVSVVALPPSPTPTATHTPTVAPSSTATVSPSPTPSPTVTPAASPTASVPPTVTTTPSPTRTPRPGEPRLVFLPVVNRPRIVQCETLVPNGAFSTNTDWLMLLGDEAARYSDEALISAPRSLRAGVAPGENVAGWSSARLPLLVPSTVTTATLTFQYLPQSGTIADTDRQYFSILNDEGSVVASTVPSGRYNASTWTEVTYNLNAYRGQRIFLYFGVKNDGTGNATRLYVDDVAVEVCTER